MSDMSQYKDLMNNTQFVWASRYEFHTKNVGDDNYDSTRYLLASSVREFRPEQGTTFTVDYINVISGNVLLSEDLWEEKGKKLDFLFSMNDQKGSSYLYFKGLASIVDVTFGDFSYEEDTTVKVVVTYKIHNVQKYVVCPD
jgi:hypothetical protein